MQRDLDVDCADFRQFIDPYLDGEFDEAERVAFDRHLTVCGECRRHFEQQAWMQGALRPALKRPSRLPPAARDRICTRLRAAERPARIRQAARRVAAPMSTLAAVGTLAVVLLSGFNSPTVMAEAVDLHKREVPVEMPSPVDREVEQWFEGKLDFQLAAPRFGDDNVVLLGGRLSQVTRPGERGRDAAYLVYGVGSHKLTVLVFDSTGLELDAPVTEVGGKPVYLHDDRGVRVALFQRGPLAYAFTSDLPQARMLELIGKTL